MRWNGRRSVGLCIGQGKAYNDLKTAGGKGKRARSCGSAGKGSCVGAVATLSPRRETRVKRQERERERADRTTFGLEKSRVKVYASLSESRQEAEECVCVFVEPVSFFF